MECYEVAEAFAAERGDDFVRISARAGRVCLSIGLFRDKEHLQLEKREGTRMTRSRGKSRERTVNEDEMDVDQEAVVDYPVEDESDNWKDIQKLAEGVAAECRGMGGTMWSVGRVIEACLTDEILKSKFVVFATLLAPSCLFFITLDNTSNLPFLSPPPQATTISVH